MNYYEHHIGDYAEATGHLTWVEDAAYSRLIRKYYATEKPLPADVKKVQRLVAARSKAEKDAVAQVLEEFFTLEEDGWHNARCDEELAKYLAAAPEREAKKANEDERQRRHREERARLFELLRERGIHLPWNTSIELLRAEVAKHGDAPAMAPAAVAGNEAATPATQPATGPATAPVTQPATATATPATANQTPDTTTHIPEEDTRLGMPTEGARVFRLMRENGIADGGSGNPDLLMLLKAGATDDEFIDAARAAVKARKGFAYALGIVKGRRRDAAQAAADLHHGPMPTAPAPDGRKARQLASAAALTGATRPTSRPHHPETVDVVARVVPSIS